MPLEPLLLPRNAVDAPGEPVAIEVRHAPAGGHVTVRRLGDVVATATRDGDGDVVLDGLDEGGYRVELALPDGRTLRTAVDVRDDVRTRLRYGFVAAYPPGADPAPLADLTRRLHLTAVQFYDWAYRHADLLGGGEEYRDALDQPVSLATVRAYAAAVRETGADALGYAAVYAVGPDEWPAWESYALLTPSGAPYALGDFLFVLDPAAPEWLEHFTADLRRSFEEVGLTGFHLDQYGYPKYATRADGVDVDVAESFVRLIEGVRRTLPAARLVFNNVNDFPTWRTGRIAQDAVYIEPWEPQLTLGALAASTSRARTHGGGLPVVFAAYQHVYDTAERAAADRATALTMATLFSHGATQLLAGEEGRVLVDPYYVRNRVAEPETLDLLTRWYDFLVEHDELLLAPRIWDVTDAYAGGYNGDLDVGFTDAEVSEEATAGRVWRRITDAGGRLVVHLVNLVGQTDTVWDAPRAAFGDPGVGRLRVRRLQGRLPRVRVADPDGTGMLTDVEVHVDGDHAIAELPPLHAWQVVVVEPDGTRL